MKSFFSALTRFSLRYQIITLALMIAFMVLGVVGVSQLKQELLPSVSFPQTVILTQVSGMSSEQVLNVLTKRIEDALGSVPEVVNAESTTTGAFGSVVIARNKSGIEENFVVRKISAGVGVERKFLFLLMEQFLWM